MNNCVPRQIEAVLDRLGMEYRKLACGDGFLYFCTPPNEVTFDLFVDPEGNVKLWRFVADVSDTGNAVKCEYRGPGLPWDALGLEVTGEGEVILFVTGKVDGASVRCEAHLYRMITSYWEMTARLHDRMHR